MFPHKERYKRPDRRKNAVALTVAYRVAAIPMSETFKTTVATKTGRPLTLPHVLLPLFM